METKNIVKKSEEQKVKPVTFIFILDTMSGSLSNISVLGQQWVSAKYFQILNYFSNTVIH